MNVGVSWPEGMKQSHERGGERERENLLREIENGFPEEEEEAGFDSGSRYFWVQHHLMV